MQGNDDEVEIGVTLSSEETVQRKFEEAKEKGRVIAIDCDDVEEERSNNTSSKVALFSSLEEFICADDNSGEEEEALEKEAAKRPTEPRMLSNAVPLAPTVGAPPPPAMPTTTTRGKRSGTSPLNAKEREELKLRRRLYGSKKQRTIVNAFPADAWRGPTHTARPASGSGRPPFAGQPPVPFRPFMPWMNLICNTNDIRFFQHPNMAIQRRLLQTIMPLLRIVNQWSFLHTDRNTAIQCRLLNTMPPPPAYYSVPPTYHQPMTAPSLGYGYPMPPPEYYAPPSCILLCPSYISSTHDGSFTWIRISHAAS